MTERCVGGVDDADEGPSASDVAEAALRDVKAICVGEARTNGWPLDPAVTRNRGVIADICDHAINVLERERARTTAPDQENARY